MAGNKIIWKPSEDGINLFRSLEFSGVSMDGGFTNVAFYVQDFVLGDFVLAFSNFNVQSSTEQVERFSSEIFKADSINSEIRSLEMK